MRKLVVFFAVLNIFVLLAAACAGSAMAEREMTAADDSMRGLARLLMKAYPDADMRLVEKTDGLFIEVNGSQILFSPWGYCPSARPDDPADAPLCAMFSQRYPLGAQGRTPARGADPGRIRNEAFLKALYGKNSQDVDRTLAPVDFFGEKLLFNTRNGADKALTRVTGKLEALAKKNPGIKAYILPTDGTCGWRTIKKVSRLSAHSFAISIDLNRKKGLYWLWNPAPDAVERTRQDYPQAIVDAFEEEGFIWGGKWYSFDFMHFEYRPELVLHGKQTHASDKSITAAR